MITKDLGLVTAYAYAVSGGYTGTEAEFTELLGNIAKDLEEIENLSVTVETLPPGSGATASYADGVLHLGIPRGDKGEKGDKGDKGDKGETGETGPQGPKGDPGDVSTEQLDEAISGVRAEEGNGQRRKPNVHMGGGSMNKVTLYNVMDNRTGKVHSVVIVKARDARFFVPVEEEKDE